MRLLLIVLFVILSTLVKTQNRHVLKIDKSEDSLPRLVYPVMHTQFVTTYKPDDESHVYIMIDTVKWGRLTVSRFIDSSTKALRKPFPSKKSSNDLFGLVCVEVLEGNY